MEIVLHDYWRSSAAYRVRLCLSLKGVAYRSQSVDLLAGEQGGAANRAINPQELVPTLMVDGRPLTQSLAIIEWLDTTFPDPPVLSRDPFVRAGQMARALAIVADIHPIDNLRVLRRLKAQFGADQAAVDDWYRHWVVTGLTALEAMAADTPPGPFLGGATMDVADLCLIPQLYNARRFDVALDAFPRLVTADAAAAALPAVAAAHPDRARA